MGPPPPPRLHSGQSESASCSLAAVPRGRPGRGSRKQPPPSLVRKSWFVVPPSPSADRARPALAPAPRPPAGGAGETNWCYSPSLCLRRQPELCCGGPRPTPSPLGRPCGFCSCPRLCLQGRLRPLPKYLTCHLSPGSRGLRSPGVQPLLLLGTAAGGVQVPVPGGARAHVCWRQGVGFAGVPRVVPERQGRLLWGHTGWAWGKRLCALGTLEGGSAADRFPGRRPGLAFQGVNPVPALTPNSLSPQLLCLRIH